MSLQSWSDRISSASWGSHGTHKCYVHQLSEGANGLSVIPASMVHPLANQFNRRLSSIHFQGRHIQVVNEKHQAFTQWRTKYPLSPDL